jgi:hypothetical protein
MDLARKGFNLYMTLPDVMIQFSSPRGPILDVVGRDPGSFSGISQEPGFSYFICWPPSSIHLDQQHC